ncbi:MAG: insulinase family protein [Flavobacteriales bacterium]|jgi:predicted Zn-dependent peptidase|nr:insulinase family protein [Flavobacteriales bacterium]
MEIKKYTLENGLKIILHQDKSSTITAVNLLYDVGARDEHEDQTGFAHLFEHLMFGGSVNIPHYDNALEKAGGKNNAFTSNDITNYYITIPKENLETALWLESDRMLSLAFSEKSLEVQRNVVIEEFKQNYLNKPYGDLYQLVREMTYKVHPYRWQTIGKELSHIENAQMKDVKEFFFKHYAPNNCILSICGNIEYDETLELIKKYFDEIPVRDVPKRNLPLEPKQEGARQLKVYRDVPAEVLIKAYKMCDIRHKNYAASVTVSNLIDFNQSALLHQRLVVDQNLFTDISAYVSGSFDTGLFYISGTLVEGADLEKANTAVEKVVEEFVQSDIHQEDLDKMIINYEVFFLKENESVLNKAMNLCKNELLTEAEDYTKALDKLKAVTPNDVKRLAKEIFDPNQCSTLFYYKNETR